MRTAEPARLRTLLFATLCASAMILASPANAADTAASLRMKADFERKRAEQQRKFEQQKREIKQTQDRLRQKSSQNLASARTGTSAKSHAPTFNAASAPPPGECLLAFVAAARSASSMEQVLRFLPEGEQQTIRADQANYDPKQAASSRAWHKKQNPNITEESLTHLSNPPFVNSLKFHKGLATEIREVLSVKIEGSQAKLVVSTTSGATVNGGYFPYSKANVEMVGEGNYWKLSRYQPSIVYYKDPPTTP